jgi:electron transport complex protein RnfG
MNPASDDIPLRTRRRQGLGFAAFVVATVLLLVLCYHIGSDRILGQRLAAERRALNAVLPAVAHDNDLLASAFTLDPAASDFQQLALLGLSSARNAYRATLQGQPSGVIVPAETTGFSGSITLMIGIDTEGSITGVRAVQHRETRGLGDRIDADVSPWIRSFNNRSLQNTPEQLWAVKKDGGDFDQFVGATVTPRAVVAAIHDALVFFDLNRDALLVE